MADILSSIISALGFAGGVIDFFKTAATMLKGFLSMIGSLFGAGGLSAYLGAAIVFVVIIIAIKLLITSSKIIITLIGIILLVLFVLTVL